MTCSLKMLMLNHVMKEYSKETYDVINIHRRYTLFMKSGQMFTILNSMAMLHYQQVIDYLLQSN